MASAFDQLGTAVPETEEKKAVEYLDFEFSFQGDELDGGGNGGKTRRILSPGDYDCIVDDVDSWSKNGKNSMLVTLIVKDGDEEVSIRDWLPLRSDMLWKSARFFASIGMWEEVKGKPITYDVWSKAKGKKARITVNTRKYTKNGEETETNNVKSYLVPGEKAVR